MINLLVALPAEAKPLIRHFALRRRSDASPFPVYANDGVSLIVSGVGKLKAAAAASHLSVASGTVPDRAWLNVGIAGDGTRALGEGVLAHSIRDAATRRCWYPPLVFQPPCETTGVLTMDEPASAYPDACSVDMEASAIYATASRFSTSELVHCFKIISDNKANPAHGISAASVERLVARRLDQIEVLVRELSLLAQEMARLRMPPSGLERFLTRWHFTVSERHRLHQLLRCWQLRGSEPQLSLAESSALAGASEVLALLERRLQDLPVKLS
jgi:adenosylhomocysteine nucleosidase